MGIEPNWLTLPALDMQVFNTHKDVPVHRVGIPKTGDCMIAGMYIVAAGTLALIEQEHKFGEIDFKVTFHRLSTKEYSVKRHDTLDAAMADFCTELMLLNPTIAQPKKHIMQEQYSEETGCGLWS